MPSCVKMIVPTSDIAEVAGAGAAAPQATAGGPAEVAGDARRVHS